MLMGMNKKFYHQTVTTKEIENYISRKLKLDLASIFDQYLRTVKIPVLEYKINEKNISYRWTNTVDNLQLPVKVSFGDNREKWILPTAEWNTFKIPKRKDGNTFTVNKNFYVDNKMIM